MYGVESGAELIHDGCRVMQSWLANGCNLKLPYKVQLSRVPSWLFLVYRVES